jgi:hypothetical protein
VTSSRASFAPHRERCLGPEGCGIFPGSVTIDPLSRPAPLPHEVDSCQLRGPGCHGRAAQIPSGILRLVVDDECPSSCRRTRFPGLARRRWPQHGLVGGCYTRACQGPDGPDERGGQVRDAAHRADQPRDYRKTDCHGKCNCYYNSAVESFLKLLKTKLVWRKNWQIRREVGVGPFEYINGFYNPRRRLSDWLEITRGLRAEDCMT